jgi:hypothetical protein
VLDEELRRRERAAVKAIWGGPARESRRPAEQPKEMCSLRDLAHVSGAFADWGGEEEP